MLDLIKQKLSLKVSLMLALVTLPPMIVVAFILTERQAASYEKLESATARAAAMTGAKMYSTALESAIDTGLLTVADAFDNHLEEIKGLNFGSTPGYHSKFDFYTDRAVRGFQDMLVDTFPDFLFAVALTADGYLPTHNSRSEQAFAGTDSNSYRSKRIYPKLPQAVGHELDPVLIAPYQRDNGDPAWNVSVPIMVKGRHWGSFQVVATFDSIASHKHGLMAFLLVVFAALAAFTIGFIIVMLGRSIRPLEHLANLADEISSGEKLDQVIKVDSSDEIGQMAKSLNRMRSSLLAAMQLLGV
jgi:HAMP domain-containing protein